MTLSNFKKLYQQFLESGLNVHDFCANQNFPRSSFYYWRKKIEPDINSDHQHTFVPLVIDSNARKDSKTPVMNCGIIAESKSTAPVEFQFPNGTKMVVREHLDVNMLKVIVHLFD